MDPRYHVAALREVRLLVSGAQSAHGVRVGAATRCGEGGVQRSNRRPARRDGGVRTSDRGLSGRGRCDLASAHHGADCIRAHQLQKSVLSSAESACVGSVIKQIVPISSIVITPSFLVVVTLTQKETKLS